MAQWTSPLKTLPRPWPHWYLAPACGMIEVTMVLLLLLWWCWWWRWCQLLLVYWDPKVVASLAEQQLDQARPTFKWDLLAVTFGYNHMDVLELCTAHRQPRSRDSACVIVTHPVHARSPWRGSWQCDSWTETPSDCCCRDHSSCEGFAWCARSIQD